MPEKYISIDKLKELAEDVYNYGHYDLYDLEMFLEDIDEHFIDKVEVIKCGYCKHWDISGHCKLIDAHIHRKYSDFCSSAERKADD